MQVKNWRNWIAITALVAYVILFWWWASAGYPTEAKICNPLGGANDCESHNILFAFVVAALDKLNFYSVFITAVATGFIAYFTLTLRRSTNKLWETEERNFREAQRAFVFIDGFNIELTTALDSDQVDYKFLPERNRSDPGIFITRFAAQPRWKNGGNTPTKQMIIQVDWRGPPGPIPPEYGYRGQPEAFFLAPKAVEPSAYIEMPGAQALINWANNPVGDSPMMWIWGRADYRDVFGNAHFVEWCYQLRFSRPVRNERLRAEFIQWGDHNRTDDST